MWKHLTATGLAGALVAFAMTPSIANEQFALTGIINLPDAQELFSFDISFVSPQTRTLAVAASRVVRQRGAVRDGHYRQDEP
jgi:hypothetical protein